MPLNNPISESQIPPPIARDAEYQAADAAHAAAADPHPAYLSLAEGVAAFLTKSQAHNLTANPDNHSTGLASNDSNIDGNIKGWHFYTSLRGNDATFGVQIAVCDTQNGLKYRRKTAGVWQPWITIV